MADPQVPGYTSIANTTGAFGLTVQNPTTLDQYTLVGGGGGGGGVATVTATDGSIVVAGTTSNPTIATGTLNAIATAHPPTASVNLNSQKIINLLNGSGAQDAAAFGQIPTALPPNGTAGGDLSGTYPNPTVAKLQTFAVATATPTSGQYLVWNAGTTSWTPTTAGGGPPTGTAGGNLGGSYPNPTVVAINGTTVPATPTTGQVLTATSGTSATWQTPASGAVSSVANSDGTLTISPTTGAVVASRPAITGDVTIAAASNAATVTAIHGTTVPATPTAGQILVATSGTAATWETGTTAGFLLAANNLSDVADAGASRFDLSIPTQSAAAAVAVANVNIASAPATIDGYTLLANDEVLLTAQTTTSQNGIWLFSASAAALTRPNEFTSGGVVKRGRTSLVTNGTVYAGTTWALASTAAGLTIDTSPQVWSEVGGVASFGPTASVRKGAVTPATGDYTAAQVTNAADKSSASTQTFTGIVGAPAGIASAVQTSGSLNAINTTNLGTNWSAIAAGTTATVAQNTTGRDIRLAIGVTDNTDTTSNAAFQMSPDNSADFVTVWRLATPTAFVGTVGSMCNVTVPAGYYVQWSAFTAMNITGTPNYY